MTEQKLQELSKKDKVTKKHNVYVHETTITYPFANVVNMKAGWRVTLEEIGNWLDKYDENIIKVKEHFADKTKEGFKTLEEENIKVIADLNEFQKLSKEEKIEKWFKEESEFIKAQEEFILKLDDRKSEFEVEIQQHLDKTISESATIKAYRVKEAKDKRDALKMWEKAEV